MATAGIKNRDGRKPELTTLRLNEGCSKYALLALSAMQCTLYSDNGKISGARLKNDLFRYQFLWRKKAVTRYMFPHWICQVLNLLTLKAAKGWKGICAPTSLTLCGCGVTGWLGSHRSSHYLSHSTQFIWDVSKSSDSRDNFPTSGKRVMQTLGRVNDKTERKLSPLFFPTHKAYKALLIRAESI